LFLTEFNKKKEAFYESLSTGELIYMASYSLIQFAFLMLIGSILF
jgi:hypothetical protein